MKKSELIKMERAATDREIMKLAKQQKLEKRYYGNYYYSPYETFFKACLKAGILRVSLFFTQHLYLGATEPVYDIFLDRQAEDFITYDYVNKKWSEAKINRLEQRELFSPEKVFCSFEDTKCIQEYLGSTDGAYDSILLFQMGIRERALERKHKKTTDIWKKRMEQVPDLPKDWNRWLFKVGITKNFIFYQYERGGAKEGYCTWCEKYVPIVGAKHNKEGKCRCCGHKIQFKAIGRCRTVRTEEEAAYLIQRCKEGFVVREFRASVLYSRNYYTKPLHFSYEQRRIIYDRGLNRTEFYYGKYKKRGEKVWIEGTLICPHFFYNFGKEIYYAGKVYGRTLPSLAKRELRNVGLREWIKEAEFVSPVYYIDALKRKPYIEKLIKAGLINLAKELMYTAKEIEVVEKKELGKSLGIDRFRMKRLRKNNGSITFLEWLKKEKEEKRIIDDKVLRWLDKLYIHPNDLRFISDRMSEQQIKNYMECQTKGQNNKVKEMLYVWKDYLSMAKRAHLDVNDSNIYRAKELSKRHDEMVRIIKDKGLVLQAAEIAEMFPQVDAICEELKAKYEYEGKDYCIIAPSEIEDILKEGRTLHHYIDKNSSYFERIAKKETYILFLRKRETPDISYYILEVEPDGTIRQKRADFNRQYADINLMEEFLGEWQKQLQKRLNSEDFELAAQSKISRIKELNDLREKNIKINGGNYSG